MSYLAFDLVEDGVPIVHYARTHGLGLEARLDLYRRMLLGLAAVHRNGLLHLDLKPDNVLIDADGEPAIVDFGLSRQVTAVDVRSAQLAATPGTVEYMSPERLRGTQAPSVQSDLYSAGVILFELVNDRLPHEVPVCIDPRAASTALQQRIAAFVPRCPGVQPLTLRGELERILAMSLMPSAALRPVSASALCKDIERVLDDLRFRSRLSQLLRDSVTRPVSLVRFLTTTVFSS